MSNDLLDELKLLGERIRDQDNQCTSHPVFLVQTKKRNYGYDPNYGNKYNTVWLHQEGFEANEVQAAVLEELKELGEMLTAAYTEEEKLFDELEEFWEVSFEDWTETSYEDTWEYEAACFTQAAADEYIARHKHNLDEPRVYVDSAHRNPEWQLIRKFLLSLVELPTKQ